MELQSLGRARREHLLCHLNDRLPCEGDVTRLSTSPTHSKAQEVDVLLFGGNHVDATVVVDPLHQLRVDVIRLVLRTKSVTS